VIRRGLFIADGSSDLPLARHLESLCQSAGSEVEVVDLPADRLPGVGRRVEDRLRAVLGQDPNFDILFVHRDSEARDPSPRFEEVASAAAALNFPGPAVAVVPIRMTEAWLLLDEVAIRLVAGSPSGSGALGLPPTSAVERIADPKGVLREALIAASGVQGRRLKMFKNQFSVHRALLLERLDPHGEVRKLSAWQRLGESIATAIG
jgi:hypothetical protein